MAKLYASCGYSRKRLSKRLKVAESTIDSFMLRHGIYRVPIRDRYTREEWIDLVKTHGSRKSIAAAVGCSHDHVSKINVHFGVRMQRRTPKSISTAKLRQLYRDIRDVKEITRILGFSGDTIAKEMAARGIVKTQEKYPWTHEALKVLYIDRGLGSHTIARIYGCDPRTVLYALKRYGIRTRPQSRSGKRVVQAGLEAASVPGAMDIPRSMPDDEDSFDALPISMMREGRK